MRVNDTSARPPTPARHAPGVQFNPRSDLGGVMLVQTVAFRTETLGPLPPTLFLNLQGHHYPINYLAGVLFIPRIPIRCNRFRVLTDL
jgi:hypothetical protein